MKNKKKIALLNPQENKAWVFAFTFYLDEGYDDLRADKLAWRDLRQEITRLKNYDGCR